MPRTTDIENWSWPDVGSICGRSSTATRSANGKQAVDFRASTSFNYPQLHRGRSFNLLEKPCHLFLTPERSSTDSEHGWRIDAPPGCHAHFDTLPFLGFTYTRGRVTWYHQPS